MPLVSCMHDICFKIADYIMLHHEYWVILVPPETINEHAARIRVVLISLMIIMTRQIVIWQYKNIKIGKTDNN